MLAVKQMIEMKAHSPLESILFPAQTERAFATFHDALDCLARIGNVDCPFALDRASGFITSGTIPKPRHQFRVAIHDKVGVVAGKYNLPKSLCFPQLLNNFEHNRVSQKLPRPGCFLCKLAHPLFERAKLLQLFGMGRGPLDGGVIAILKSLIATIPICPRACPIGRIGIDFPNSFGDSRQIPKSGKRRLKQRIISGARLFQHLSFIGWLIGRRLQSFYLTLNDLCQLVCFLPYRSRSGTPSRPPPFLLRRPA